jgi:hypothetical protein
MGARPPAPFADAAIPTATIRAMRTRSTACVPVGTVNEGARPLSRADRHERRVRG